MADDTTQQATTPGATPNKGTLQSYVQNFTIEAIDCLVEIMRTSRNESLKLGAAKTIIDKSIADVKAVELTGQNGGPIPVTIISGSDYISAIGKITAASEEGSIGRSPEVQGTDLAQESAQDNNSNQPVSEVEST